MMLFPNLLYQQVYYQVIFINCYEPSLHVSAIVKSIPYTGLFEMIVRVLTTCHTQHTWDSSM